jgi:hypothetical protein
VLVGALNLLTKVDTSGLTSGLEKMKKRISRFARSGQGMLAGLGVGISAYKLIDFLGQSTTAAADLEESLSKIGVIFGPQASLITDAADKMAERFGTVKREYIDAAAQFGLMFKGIGMAQQESANLGNQLAVLGMDLASFFNTANEEAFTALAAALRGEFNPLERFGVFLTADAVKLNAVEKGLAASTGQVSEQAKKLTILSEILAQTTDAQGDLERTSEGTKNQMRKLAGQWENMKVTIGQGLIEPTTMFIEKLMGLEEQFKTTFSEDNVSTWADAFVSAVEAAMSAVGLLSKSFQGLQSLSRELSKLHLDPAKNQKYWNDVFKVTDAVRNAGLMAALPGGGVLKGPAARPAVPSAALTPHQLAGMGLALGHMISTFASGTAGGVMNDAALRADRERERMETLAAFQREHAGRADLAAMGSQDAYRTISAFRGGQPMGKAAEETAKNTRAMVVQQVRLGALLRNVLGDAPPVTISG